MAEIERCWFETAPARHDSGRNLRGTGEITRSPTLSASDLPTTWPLRTRRYRRPPQVLKATKERYLSTIALGGVDLRTTDKPAE